MAATTMTGSLPNHQHAGRCGAASITVTVSVCGGALAIPVTVIQCDQAQGHAGLIGVVSSSVSLAGRSPADTTAGQHPVTRPGTIDRTHEADRLAEDERPPLSYERALRELAHGQVLRRSGQRARGGQPTPRRPGAAQRP
jgi:hypothetical protein